MFFLLVFIVLGVDLLKKGLEKTGVIIFSRIRILWGLP